MGEQRNIIEDIAKDLIERSMGLRFDICRCEVCKKKIREIVVGRIPPYFVDANRSEHKDIFNHVMTKHFKQFLDEVTYATNYVNKNPPHELSEDREKNFKQLLERIYQDRGLDFSQYHRRLLKRRVALRLKARKVNSYSEYLTVLADDPDEYEKLFEVLTINVSEFFRNKEVWVKIENILRDSLTGKNASSEPLRIWHAGCAHGEEPYSLAITIKELAPKRRFEIYATDVDTDAIVTARKGNYGANSLKNVPKNILSKYFRQIDSDNYVLDDEIKKMIMFKRHDLINDLYLPRTDIILCRNVFIYFVKPLQEQILNKFYNSLKKNGYLVIGMTETIISEAKLIFSPVNIDYRIYRKKEING